MIWDQVGTESREQLHLVPQKPSSRIPSLLPIMFYSSSLLLMAAAGALTSPLDSCPKIHVFGARETTAPQGYGTAATVVNLVTSSHSGATAEAIVYPACGGQSSCGGVSYANSAAQGTSAVATAVNAFNQKCPNTELVLVGYSQVRFSIVLEKMG
jgi:acetylxylan esterase